MKERITTDCTVPFTVTVQYIVGFEFFSDLYLQPILIPKSSSNANILTSQPASHTNTLGAIMHLKETILETRRLEVNSQRDAPTSLDKETKAQPTPLVCGASKSKK